MTKRIFVAGATGVIGRRLVPQLVAAGHQVTGMTRSADKAGWLRAIGADAAVADAFDPVAVMRAVDDAAPDAVLHQLTDLSGGFDPAVVQETIRLNARIRTEGTRHLVAAARVAGVSRLIAQSIAWIYAKGPLPHREDDPLDRNTSAPTRVTVDGVVTLENAVLAAAPIDGIILRYGHFYGPGTRQDQPADPLSVHVDAAARAAVLAIDHGAPGIYNIVDPNGAVDSGKAQRELGWSAHYRDGDG